MPTQKRRGKIMAYAPKPAVKVRLTGDGLWTTELNWDRILEAAPERPPFTPFLMNWQFDLDGVEDELPLEPELYQVSFTLGAPFNNPAQPELRPINDSLIGYGRTSGGFLTQDGVDRIRVRIIPNECDRMSTIAALVPVTYDPQDAEDIAYRAVRPVLSQISMLYQVPLETVAVETFRYLPPDQVWYQRTILYPYPTQQFRMADFMQLHQFAHYDSFLKAANHFREGLNCWSPLHRFLSLFKAIEALQGLQKDIRKEHGKVRFPRTYVSDNYAIRLFHSDCVGKPHLEIANHYFPSPYRNAVAHWGENDELDTLYDYRNGLLRYHFLCVLAQDVFTGLLKSTLQYEVLD